MSTAKDESYNDELWYQNRIAELEQENELNINRIEVLQDDLKLFQKENLNNMQKARKLKQQVEELKKENVALKDLIRYSSE